MKVEKYRKFLEIEPDNIRESKLWKTIQNFTIHYHKMSKLKTLEIINQILLKLWDDIELPSFLVEDLQLFLDSLNYYKAGNVLKNYDKFSNHIQGIIWQYNDENARVLAEYMLSWDSNHYTKTMLTLINNIRSIFLLTITEFSQANSYRVFFKKKIQKWRHIEMEV